MVDTMHAGATCKECKRSFRGETILVQNEAGEKGMQMTIVQTGGPDVPAYLPAMRRANT